LHLKPEGEELECYCGDVCKTEISGDYKTLWHRYWMCNNLTYDPELGDTEVWNNQLFCDVSSQVLNELWKNVKFLIHWFVAYSAIV
jgi:hypothetical protein